MDQALAHGHNLGGGNLIYHVAFEAANGRGLCDEDDILVLVWLVIKHKPVPERSSQGVSQQRRTKTKLDNSQNTSNTRNTSRSLGGCGAAISQTDITSWTIDHESRRIGRGWRSKCIRIVGDLDIDVTIRHFGSV